MKHWYKSLLNNFIAALAAIVFCATLAWGVAFMGYSDYLQDIANFTLSGKSGQIIKVNTLEDGIELSNTLSIDSINLTSGTKYQVGGAQIDYDDMAGVGSIATTGTFKVRST